MDLSVIIPAHNRAKTIGATLWSLIHQGLESERYEIIVVDNNSRDETASVVQKIQSESPVLIKYHFEPRQGVHYARNWAAVHARGKILYFTDDDMLAENGTLRALLRMFELDDKIATATGKVLPKWECEPPEWIKQLCQNGFLSLQLRQEELIISPEDVGVYSCHQAIRKSVLLECGGFNPENTAGEWVGDGETGLNLKLRALGYKFAFTSKAVTHHVIPPERMTQQYLNKRLKNQGNADAYTWFRANRPTNYLLFRNQVRCVFESVRECVRLLKNLLQGRSEWRLSRARICYYRARSQYNQRLKHDAHWRNLVLRDNWIEEAK
jgi:glucosyl-dolichyl phosphate glucuronosyltransferase